MPAKETALEACNDAFAKGIENLVVVFGREVLAATTQRGKDAALTRFKAGVTHQKQILDNAVVAIEEIM